MKQNMAKDVEGFPLVCEYCNTEFGITFFVWSVSMHCPICSDSDEPCPECGIAPAEDGSIKHVCKKCQIEHGIVISGEHV